MLGGSGRIVRWCVTIPLNSILCLRTSVLVSDNVFHDVKVSFVLDLCVQRRVSVRTFLSVGPDFHL